MTASIHVGANVRVTIDTDSNDARNESTLAVNPTDSRNMAGASKRFIDPTAFQATVAAYATHDGGDTWTEAAALELLPGTDRLNGPGIAFSGDGWTRPRSRSSR